MTHRFKGERTLMRVFVGEADKCTAGKYKGRPLYEALLLYFREHDLAGVTVLRGVSGYGAHSRIHTDKVLRLSLDLPMVVEVVDSEEKIQAVLPELDGMIDGGLITLERVRVILYRPHDVAEDEKWQHRIEGLEAEPGSD
jgi:PII-like signaling protein